MNARPRFANEGLRTKFLALMVTSLLVLAACGDSGSGGGDATGQPAPGGAEGQGGGDASPAQGGVLRVASANDVTTLDPHAGTSGYDYFMIYPMYDTLIGFEPDTLASTPRLAESWQFIEPQVLELALRDGVTFHDGTPFNAEAVAYNLDRVKSSEGSNIKNDLATVESVEVVDDLTVRLHLTEPNVALLGILADRAGMMISPTASEELGDGYASAPVGTGPFVFQERRPGQLISYTANQEYWDPEVPYLDGLEFRILAEPETRLNGLLTGEIDFVHRLQPQDVAQIETSDDYEHQQYVGIGDAKIVYFDASSPPFDDKLVRQAVNLAVDRDALAEAATFGTAEPAFMPIPSAHWAHQDELAPGYEHDPERARELLAEAGHPDGLSFTLVHQPDSVDTRVAEIFQAQLAEAGIRVELVPVELTQSVTEYFTDRKYDAGSFGWTGRPDPNMTFLQIYGKDTFFNAGKHEIPGLAELLQEAASTEDIEQRDAVFKELVELTLDEAIIAPLFFRATIDAYRAEVEGYEPNLLSKPRFERVSLHD